MRVVIVRHPPVLDWTLAGLEPLEHLRRALAPLGTVHVVNPDDPVGPLPAVVVDGRAAALSASVVQDMLTVDGQVLAGDTGVIAAQATKADQAAGLTLSVTEADLTVEGALGWLVTDGWTFTQVEAAIRLRIIQAWAREGVRFVDPHRTVLDATVTLESGCVLGPGVTLLGQTSVAAGATVQDGCWLRDTRVGERALLKPYSVTDQAIIGPQCQVGPMAHLRPGTVLEARAKVGNFVETKKAHIMAGAKANHHAYLGDVSVGARANIGAGTITCNYDGFAKHKTVIEAGAFIGTDSQLVAPVTVGRDAYVGAGTTVTRDVPRSSLALSRVKQLNVEGWADRFHEAQSKRKGRNKS